MMACATKGMGVVKIGDTLGAACYLTRAHFGVFPSLIVIPSHASRPE
jgi:hypothetical protein